jgi:hypothetical protein
MHRCTRRWPAFFAGLDGWVSEPEVSFSIYGERGIIDVLAWHPVRRILLMIELKTELVDINDLMGSADRRRRLGAVIARDRGWDPAAIATWVVLAESRPTAALSLLIARWFAQSFRSTDVLCAAGCATPTDESTPSACCHPSTE